MLNFLLQIIKMEESNPDSSFSEFRDLFSFPESLLVPAAPSADALSKLEADDGYEDSTAGGRGYRVTAAAPSEFLGAKTLLSADGEETGGGLLLPLSDNQVYAD